MSGTGDYISREAAIEALEQNWYPDTEFEAVIGEIPAADVRPVVLCGVCKLHGHCYTEDVFAFARLAEANRFCAVGKVKANGEGREES